MIALLVKLNLCVYRNISSSSEGGRTQFLRALLLITCHSALAQGLHKATVVLIQQSFYLVNALAIYVFSFFITEHSIFIAVFFNQK